MALINRVRTVWSGVPGTPYYTNMYFLNGDLTPDDAVVQVRALLTAWSGLIRNELTATIDPEVPLIDSVTGDIQGVDSVSSTPVVGAGTLQALPRATQGLIRLQTGAYQGGRNVRGRLFLPGVMVGANDDGKPSSFFIQDVSSAFSAFMASVQGDYVVWSRKSGGVAPVSGFSVWNEWAQLRSRRD